MRKAESALVSNPLKRRSRMKASTVKTVSGEKNGQKVKIESAEKTVGPKLASVS